MRTLVFTNSDARPKVTKITCDTASVPNIMAWYGSFFAKDRYSVTLDGEKVPMDQNGEPVDFKELQNET